MNSLGLAADIRKEIEASTSLVDALSARWPEAINLRSDRSSSYLNLPYHFLPAFPHLPLSDIRPLAAFTRLMNGAILQHDTLADGDIAAPRTGEAAMRLMAMQFEACHVLYPSIPAQAPFWERLRTDLAEYAHACVEERRFAQGERPWREYTEAVARRIVLGKNGVARAVAAGLVELARDERLLTPLLETIDAFNFASQMCDDLLDWRDDAYRSIPSLLLARVLRERPALHGAAMEHELDRLGRELYQGRACLSCRRAGPVGSGHRGPAPGGAARPQPALVLADGGAAPQVPRHPGAHPAARRGAPPAPSRAAPARAGAARARGTLAARGLGGPALPRAAVAPGLRGDASGRARTWEGGRRERHPRPSDGHRRAVRRGRPAGRTAARVARLRGTLPAGPPRSRESPPRQRSSRGDRQTPTS